MFTLILYRVDKNKNKKSLCFNCYYVAVSFFLFLFSLCPLPVARCPVSRAQLVPTGSGGQGQENGGKGGAGSYGGLFAELDQVESRDGTYPATEGFCCLIQVPGAQ